MEKKIKHFANEAKKHACLAHIRGEKGYLSADKIKEITAHHISEKIASIEPGTEEHEIASGALALFSEPAIEGTEPPIELSKKVITPKKKK